MAVGPGTIVASCLTPLAQAWLARAGAGRASEDPYFLYAASNAGSAGALLAYPFVLEPWLGIGRQTWGWSLALGALVPFALLGWWWANRKDGGPKPGFGARERSALPLPAARILALSAVPSALLLGVTQFLTTDVAAVPLLWIVPLVLYLGTFVHAFARRPPVPLRIVERAVSGAVLIIAVAGIGGMAAFAASALHLAGFTIIALWCHGAIARLRPRASDLTRFYLLVSTGGVTGGVLAAIVAPLVFDDVHEYPIALACAVALLPAVRRGKNATRAAIGLAGTVIVSMALMIVNGAFGSASGFIFGAEIAVVACTAPMILFLRPWPWLLAGAMAAVSLGPRVVHEGMHEPLARERTFFGVYRVVEDQRGVRTFRHGTTLHGAEWPRGDGTVVSRTLYFGPGTPYAEVMEAATRRERPVTIAIAGLGTGSLACYARPGDRVIVHEIDPAVVRIAREHFAALDACAPEAKIRVGDARLGLETESEPIDLLALDAFSSNAIPVHLLTAEAFRIYERALAPEGVVIVHISNRYLDLEPVIAAVADELGLAAQIRRQSVHLEKGARPLQVSSTLIALARGEETLERLELGPEWTALRRRDGFRVWTDDYTSIVPIIYWWK